ncbi:hypothetical protein HGB07_09160, partial [Candidatus Roizmanbacteria bacterium]|nr:hypothetical protein [Candidatus Roizmanbacteria bacterium]
AYSGNTRFIPDIQGCLNDDDENVKKISLIAISQICQSNKKNLELSWRKCLCKQHLTKYSFIELKTGFVMRTGYYACRICHASDKESCFYPVTKVVLSLDNPENATVVNHENSTIHAVWFAERGMFDFDEIELRSGSIDDEQFILQYINDTDPTRPWKLKNIAMEIKVVDNCKVKPATNARLSDYFAIVE